MLLTALWTKGGHLTHQPGGIFMKLAERAHSQVRAERNVGGELIAVDVAVNVIPLLAIELTCSAARHQTSSTRTPKSCTSAFDSVR